MQKITHSARRPVTVVAAFAAFATPLAATAPAQAATRQVHVSYQDSQGFYDVRFNGTVSHGANPLKYIIDGELNAYCHHGTITDQSVAVQFGPANKNWQHRGHWCDDTPVHIHDEGWREKGVKIRVRVGATSGIANTYNYGTGIEYNIDK
jgi:hypothetical protein